MWDFCEPSATVSTMTLPILYSFRRCPYAMRARLAIAYAGIQVELREVVLKNKPEAMLEASPKGTVPVLIQTDGSVIDESIDIMRWALDQHDPQDWTSPSCGSSHTVWIEGNDSHFKYWLDRYKYADRYPDHSAEWYRDQTHDWLSQLDTVLRESPWLHGDHMGFADAALLPFIRQFVMVDLDWFHQAPFGALRRWLDNWLAAPLFIGVMDKYSPWQPSDQPIYFPT